MASRQKPSPRFAPGDFVHNGRVAVAIFPAVAVMVGFGGTMVAGVCMLGAVAAYVLDALRQREGALAAIWITLAAANLFLITSNAVDVGSRPIFLCLLVLGGCSAVLFVMGCWATLQFRWVQMQYPPVVLALERIVLAGSVTIAGSMIAWGTIAAVGAASAPFYVACIMSALYMLLAVPLPSAFHAREVAKGGTAKAQNPEDYAALGRVETAACAGLTSFLPAAMFIGIHYNALDQSDAFWSLLLLASGPLLVVLASPGGLWWLPMPKAQHSVFRWIAALFTLAILVAGIEGAVIFTSFKEYILLHPPWDWILVSSAIYGHAAVVLLHFSGALRNGVVYTICLVCLLGFCAAACAAVGLPWNMVPAPLISAAGMGLYYRSRMLYEYALFLTGAGITGLWFIHQHFWFLDVAWAGHMTVKRVCIMLVAYIGPTVLLPGLLVSGAPKLLCGIALLLHSIFLAASEVVLFSGNETFGELYPAYCVLATSVTGFVIAGQLLERSKVPAWSAWGSRLLYAAKASLLVVPNPRQTLHVALVSGAAMAPVIMHPQKPGAVRRTRLAPGALLVYFSFILFATWESRHSIFSAIGELTGTLPGEGRALGCLLLALALAVFPLVSNHCSGSALGKQGMILLLAAGMLLVAVHPPLPVHAICHPHHKHHHHARWVCLHIFDRADHVSREVDDIAVYGAGIARKEHWAVWLLVLALLAGIAAGGQQRSIRSSGLVGRLVLGLLSGGAVGGFVALELFPQQGIMQILLLAICLLVAVAVVLVSMPAGSSPVLLPPVLLLWAVLLPASLMMERELPLPESHAQRIAPDAPFSVQDERRTFRFVSLLIVYAIQSTLLAFCFKLKISGRISSIEQPASDRVRGASPSLGGSLVLPGLSGFLGRCLPSAAVSMGAYTRVRAKIHGVNGNLQAEGLGWLPTACNLITILCFVLCVVLDRMWFEGGELVVLPLCSLLLLLHQDPFILPSLLQRRRYFPPLIAAVLHLVLVSITNIIQDAANTSLWASAMQILYLMMALPSHVLFLWYLWDWSLQSFIGLVFVLPLNLLSVALTAFSSVRLLAGMGVCSGLLHWFIMSKTRRSGMRVI